ncbi:hypothetical protein E8E12_000891 [Didymella heteroderae]|uniref:LDB19 N-terminal domain-containing protein n=1 Tax=Didymella heteroderae TaxID=1769908 RepID=A0A9P5BUA3_9PLEO|nr:hypothetical protein E8E12_000891 [Didymella heteroderae]
MRPVFDADACGGESSSTVFIGSPQVFSGAFLSGQHFVDLLIPHITINQIEMRLLAINATKKRVAAKRCGCNYHAAEIYTWRFCTRSAVPPNGLHSFPLSCLLPGYLPATIDSAFATLDYYLSADVMTSAGKFTYARTIEFKRAIFLGTTSIGRVLRDEVRVIASEDVKTGWRTDFETGVIDVEFNVACNVSLKPLCNVESQCGINVKHNFVIRMVVAKERAPSVKLSETVVTGAALVLCAQSPLVFAECPETVVGWNKEQPPTYESASASPPTYMDACN